MPRAGLASVFTGLEEIAMEFSRFARPVGGLAVRARQQALYGLKHVTPEILKELRSLIVTCPQCNGTGLQGTYGNLGWRACPRCHGLGEVYKDLVRFRKRRWAILQRHPELEVPVWEPGRPIRCPALDLKTDVITDACPLQDEDLQLELF